jgi:hypothetical protein
MSADWRMTRAGEACSGCAAPFAADEDVFSLLRFAGNELQRGDLCRGCFDARDPAADVVWWRTRARKRAAALRVDFDLLLAAMARLAEDARATARDLAFLLALLLVRHRRLRLLRVEKRRGCEVLILRKVRTTREFPVESRELDEEQRQRLRARLAELMDPTREGGLEALLSVSEDVSS